MTTRTKKIGTNRGSGKIYRGDALIASADYALNRYGNFTSIEGREAQVDEFYRDGLIHLTNGTMNMEDDALRLELAEGGLISFYAVGALNTPGAYHIRTSRETG